MALTPRIVLAALAGVLVVVIAVPSTLGVVAVTGTLGLLVAVDVLLAASVRRLLLSREGPDSVRLGETVDVRILVTNPGPRPLRGRLRDGWPPSAGAADQRHAVDVPPGQRRAVTTRLCPTRRGDRRADRITVRAVGPLGLAGRQGSHRIPGTVRALPAFESRRHLPSRLARLRELDGRAAVQIRGQGTEFDSLRDYVIGDDVRSIDWRATARRAGMVVRTWRPERDRRVVLVLDTGRTSAGRVGDAPRLDHAMDAALLLGALATRAGDRVDLLAYDRLVRARVRRPAPTEVLPQLTRAMATLDSALVETDYRGLATTIAMGHSQRSLIVWFTGLDAAVVEEGILPVLGPLVRRHEILIASVADPRIAELAAGRGSVDAVYAAASAERARAERRETAALLRRHGVTVVDEPARELAPAVADAYLALKRAGRL